jgi:hypothetical protein
LDSGVRAEGILNGVNDLGQIAFYQFCIEHNEPNT